MAGCHYFEEEISQQLKRNIGYWPVQMNGNKFATGQILKKTGRSCEGADFSWLSSKISRTMLQMCSKPIFGFLKCNQLVVREDVHDEFKI